MRLQVIHDSNGNDAGVFIPMNDWQKLKKQYKNLEVLEYEEPTKEHILQGIKQAVKEINLIKAGKLKARPLKELLDEL